MAEPNKVLNEHLTSKSGSMALMAEEKAVGGTSPEDGTKRPFSSIETKSYAKAVKYATKAFQQSNPYCKFFGDNPVNYKRRTPKGNEKQSEPGMKAKCRRLFMDSRDLAQRR